MSTPNMNHIQTGQLLDTIRELSANYWQAPTVETAELYAVEIIDAFADLDEVLREGGALPTEWASTIR